MIWPTLGWSLFIAVVVICLIEIRRVVLSLNADMRQILNGQHEIRRRLDVLEKERRK